MTNEPSSFNLAKMPFDRLYIDGGWVKPSSKEVIEVISPITEKPIFSAVDAGEADVEKAVTAARRAFDEGAWPELPLKERAKYLTAFADNIEDCKDELAAAWSSQIGMSSALANRFAPSFANIVRQYVALCDSFELEQERPTMMPADGYIFYEPAGVVAAIAPWNVPTNTMLNKVTPALLAGCTVIAKPAPETPAEAYIIAQCAHDAGFPPGVFNLISAGRAGSDALVRQPGIDKVSFTGSVATGRHIAEICASRFARCTLELGGKSAAIVLDDYDLEAAATMLANGICSLSGQNCGALSRVLVSRDRHDELVGYLKANLEAVTVGPGEALGPLATQRQLARVEGYVAKGVEEGATLVTGGKRAAGIESGYFFEPTLFADVNNDMTIAREEIFGPVLCVLVYDDIEDAISIANDSPYGLVGAVFTNDAQKAKYIARRMRTGTVGQNGPKVDFGIGFGGFKQSGIGREGGIQGLMSYLEPKTVLLEKQQ